MSNEILCLNPGSSSLRHARYSIGDEKLIVSGHLEGLDERDLSAYRDAVSAALGEQCPSAIGYRIVHGGDLFSAPTIIDDSVLAGLRSLEHLAPQHLPTAIATIETARERFPDVPHIACFDTAFHQRLPEVAQHFPLPGELFDQRIRRYGFHGLSYEYIVGELGSDLPDRTIIAHLGNGSSLVALWRGEPVETTMGMTPCGGLMMGSRSGDLDPGILIHLLRENKMTADELDELFNKKSGLKGVSGLTSDMRELLSLRKQQRRAALAVEMYCYSARKHVGALTAALGGLDLLVFTGGIGENSATVREEILQELGYLDFEIDVIPTDETRMVARHVAALTDS